MAKRTFGIPDDTKANGFGNAPENIKQQYQVNRCFMKPDYPVENGKVWAITDIKVCDPAWTNEYVKQGYVVCTVNEPSTPKQSPGGYCDLNMNIRGSNNFVVIKYEIVDIFSDKPVLTDIYTKNSNRDVLESLPGMVGMVGITTVGIPQHGNKSIIAQNKGTTNDCSHYQGCWVKFESINRVTQYINSVGINVMSSNSDAPIQLISYILDKPINLTNRSAEELHTSCGRGKSTLYLNAAYVKIQRAVMNFRKLGNKLEFYGMAAPIPSKRMLCPLVNDNLFDITEIISDYVKYFNIENPVTGSIYLYVPIDNLPNDPGEINKTTPPPIQLKCEITGYPINVINSTITLQGFLKILITSNES
jgi:hypothetical protein